MAEALLTVAKQRYGRIAAVTEERGFPQAFTQSFIEVAQSTALSIDNQLFPSGITDFRPLLIRLKSRAPEALLISTDSANNLLLIVKQLAEIGWKPPLLSQYIAGIPTFYQNARGLADGMIFGDTPDVACAAPHAGCAVYLEFVRRYGEPKSSSYMVGSSIAAFMALASAARSGTDPHTYLYEAQLDTPLGVISFDGNGDVVGPKHTLKIIEGSRPRPYLHTGLAW